MAVRRTFVGRLLRNRAAVMGLVILALVIALAVLGPMVYPADPFGLVGRPFLEPFGRFLLGTDILGRDVAVGIMYGARTSLIIGVVATIIAVAVGTILGGAAGYYGGALDRFLTRVTEIFQTIPAFIFAIVIVAVLSPSIRNVIAAIAIVSWPPMARLVRGEFLAMRKREFVQACVGLGMPDSRIIVRHILPNALSPIIVTGSLMIANAILVESALSFLGLSDPNVMSWGFMIGAGRPVLRTAWWLCAIPGIAILLTVLSINLVGEGLNDALNPRLRSA